MNRKVKFIIYSVVLLFIFSVIGIFIVMKPSESNMVEIVQDGNVIYTFDLSSAENQNIEVEYNGYKNIITINDGEIYVSEAECSDNTCVKMGTLKSASLPVVCLPNHLIIRFSEE